MTRLFKLLFFPGILLLITLLTPFWLANAQAAFYKYVDKNGNIHFTDSLDSVPEEYRDQLKVYQEPKSPETTSPPTPEKEGATGEPARKLREAEEKKQAEQARALQEKAARDEKLKDRQQKEERIAELQMEIIAKREEQRGLRTTWMVYDRIRLNQLNDEIAGLEREIESIRLEILQEKN